VTGAELKRARHSLGFTQAKLGARIDLTRVMVGQMERRANPVRERTVLAVWCLLYEAGVAQVGDRTEDMFDNVVFNLRTTTCK